MVIKPQQPAPWSKIQHEATALGPEQNGVVHLDGVRWDIVNNEDGTTQELGVFRDAFINTEAVEDVFLTVKPFTDKPGNYPGHAQLHFEFRKDSPIRDSLGNTDHGLVLSVEPKFREGEAWTPGGQDPQPVVYQLGTWTDSIEKATVHHHYPLHIYKLALNEEQKVALLRERLAVSVQDHSQDIYDPVTNSCISTLIDGVNKVVPLIQKIPPTDPNRAVPIWCPKSFKKYRLLAQNEPTVVPAQPESA